MGSTNSKEEFAPEESARTKSKSLHTISGPTKFKKHIHVSLDEEGKLEGMPEQWVDLLELSPEMIAYKISTEDLDENVKPLEPDARIINTIKSFSPWKFTIYKRNNEVEEEKESEYNIELDEDSEVCLKGLPESWKKDLKNSDITKEEIRNNTIQVLETLDWMERKKTGSLHPLPTNSMYKKMQEEKIVFSKTNPKDDFIILEILGEGGFGKVYKTIKISDQKMYAMKHVDITCNKQKIYLGNEITIMKAMNHKNIVKLYETYMYQGRVFMLMEYLDGGCLTPIVEDLTESIPENVIAFILRETLEGIHQLHKKGIIHRDIKSDNILISKFDDSIKLTDFGYSCQLTQEKRMRESRVGTLYWMAPEILKGSNLYDEKCDIWSLGVFAFELAEGVPPFPKKGQQRAIYNILSKPPPTLKDKEKWSENFHSFIEQWMMKDPKMRPNAKELLKHPFLHDFDYDEYKQEYLDFKEKILRQHNIIKEDDEEWKYETFDSKSKRVRSKTIIGTPKP